MFLSHLVFSQDESKMEKLFPLVGDYNLITYDHFTGNWTKGSSTKSNIEKVFDGVFLKESVVYSTENMNITMITYIGYDQRIGKYKLCAMDKEFQSMDIYFGDWEESKLVFTNLYSDKPFTMDDGSKFHFRLTYSFTENGFNHLVEGTKDEGKSWMPFSKSEFNRIN